MNSILSVMIVFLLAPNVFAISGGSEGEFCPVDCVVRPQQLNCKFSLARPMQQAEGGIVQFKDSIEVPYLEGVSPVHCGALQEHLGCEKGWGVSGMDVVWPRFSYQIKNKFQNGVLSSYLITARYTWNGKDRDGKPLPLDRVPNFTAIRVAIEVNLKDSPTGKVLSSYRKPLDYLGLNYGGYRSAICTQPDGQFDFEDKFEVPSIVGRKQPVRIEIRSIGNYE